jgi:hypothetical protein
LYYSFFALAVMAIIAFGLVKYSSTVQTRLAQAGAEWFTKKTGYPINIEKASVEWLKTLKLENLEIKNMDGDSMIHMKELHLSFELASLQNPKNLNIDHLKLVKPYIYYSINAKTGKHNIDDFIRAISSLSGPKKKKDPNKRPQLFTIDNAEIIDGTFYYEYQKAGYHNQRGRFEESHFAIEKLNTNIKNFLAVRDTIAMKIELSGLERRTRMPIHALNTDFLLCKKSMVFNDLYAHLGKTKIKNYIRLDYKKFGDLSKIFTHVNYTARLDSSEIHSEDIAHFVPSIGQYKDIWKISTDMSGTINNLSLKKTSLYFGKNSKLIGDFAFVGLPNINKTTMDLRMNKSRALVSDLKPYLDSKTITNLETMNFLAFDGSFKGTTQSFKTNGIFETALGKITADLAMQNGKTKDQTAYEGRLILDDFNIGKVLGEGTELENVSMDGKVKGVGLSVKDAVLEVDGTFKNIRYKGYTYKNVYMQGQLQRELFEGFASCKDSNFVFDMKGIVNLREQKENFNISGQLAKSNLKKLNLTKDDISLSTIFNVSFSGTNIDNILGFARLRQTDIRIANRHLAMDTLFVYSALANNERSIIIDSDLARLRFDGNYTPSIAIGDIKQLAQEYKAYFTNDRSFRSKYYSEKALQNRNYNINYSLSFLDSKPLMQFIAPGVYISNYSPIEGNFKMGKTVMLNFEGKADTLTFGNYAFYNSNFDISTSKFVNEPEVLASGLLESENQKLSGLAATEKLFLEGAWDQDRIVFESNIKQTNSTNRADLGGSLLFTDTGIDLRFKRSNFTLLDQKWNVNPGNLLSIKEGQYTFNQMNIENNGQILAFDGTVSADSLHTLKLNATDFDVASVAPILNLEVSGKLNGELSMNNLLSSPTLDGNLSLDSLMYNKIFIGDLAGKTTWDKTDKILNINYYIDRLGLRMMNLRGVYAPNLGENSLDLLATLNSTNLSMVEPFTKGIFSKFEGTASGQVHIIGSPSVPELEGEVTIQKGKVLVDYLNTPILFEDKVTFEPNRINTDNLRLSDPEGHTGNIKGGVSYNTGMKNMRLNLNGVLNNFKVLNTTLKNNDTYYGTAYATGNVRITGPLNDIYIYSKATTNKGTKIYIPLDGATSVGKSEHIEYIANLPDNDQQTELGEAPKVKSSTNLHMDFNFNITPDAFCELQVDRQSGDLIKAYGKADLNLKVNTLGDFTMNGIYELDRGDYSFNFETFVNKSFKILPKSKIIWTGDPLEADLDIKTEYTQYTSLLPIFPQGSLNQDNTSSDLNRKYPVSVVLNLKDRMLSPKVSYDIDFKDYPKTSDFNNNILAFKNKIYTNEQELSRQVGSLILTQRLIEQSSDAFRLENFTNNFSEFLTNQVSKWASGNNFQFGINGLDFSSLNQDLINNMQLQFSYNFDDRLRISHSRNGFLGGNSQQTTTDGANYGSLIGDWSLEWLITKDGRLKLKGYNRNTPNTFQNISLSNSATSYGASIIYSKSFNKILSSPKVVKPGLQPDIVMKTP